MTLWYLRDKSLHHDMAWSTHMAGKSLVAPMGAIGTKPASTSPCSTRTPRAYFADILGATSTTEESLSCRMSSIRKSWSLSKSTLEPELPYDGRSTAIVRYPTHHGSLELIPVNRGISPALANSSIVPMSSHVWLVYRSPCRSKNDMGETPPLGSASFTDQSSDSVNRRHSFGD